MDRGQYGPVDGLRPLGVTIGDRRSQRLLREDLRKDRERLGPVGELAPQRGELAAVGRPAVALPGDERLLDQLGALERSDLPVEPETSCLGGGVALGRRALRDADDHAVEVVDRRETAVGADHDALTVVERRGKEGGSFGAVAAGRPRGVADQDVDLAGLQRREAVGGLDIDHFDRLRVAEYRGRDDSAEVAVEADVIAFGCQHREAWQGVAGAAPDDVVGDHGVERRLGTLDDLDGVVRSGGLVGWRGLLGLRGPG